MDLSGDRQKTGYMSGENALKQLMNLQRMIDIWTTKLLELRGLGLNEFTLKEIRILEGKLIKHFSEQLDAKTKVMTGDWLAELQRYPSVSKWLAVVGVSSLLANALKSQGRSVEELLQLSKHQLRAIVIELGGDSEDNRKLGSSLTQLKQFHKRRKLNIDNLNTKDVFWDSWSKSGDEEEVFKLEQHKNDFNENHKSFIENGSFDHSNEPSRNGSESSDSIPSDATSSSRLRTNTDPSNPDMDVFSSTNHNQPLPSTSSSCLTPPSPSYLSQGSRSSLDSDSGASGSKIPRSSSPPLHPSKLFVIPPSTGQNTLGVYTPPVTPGTPHKSQYNLVQSNPRSVAHPCTTLSRERVSSTGAGTSLGRSNKLNPNSLLGPLNNLKSSKSSEWLVGSRIQPGVGITGSMSASNQSLSSIATLPEGKSKHLKPPKKGRKHRPGNLVLNESELPDFIRISRTGVTASRRSSTTISPESGLNSISPLSPRTPMTPATPLNPDMWRRDGDLASQYGSLHTPKTPKSTFQKSVKVFFHKLAKRTKLKRNKSIDQMLDDPPQSSQSTTLGDLPPRRRSDTMPGEKSMPPMFAPSESLFTQTPPQREPPLHDTCSSYSPSLVGTDRTLVPDSLADDKSDTLVRQESLTGIESEEKSTLTEDNDFSENVTMRERFFRQESTTQSTSEEFDIPYDELDIREIIGQGRVGRVHKGYWHGDVAIRVIDVYHNDEDKLRAFKQEVMTYKKTRHENLELFMGSCMDPKYLAIVTGFCHGKSLYNYIRESRKQLVSVNQAKIIAQHIVQGMGYLHSKGVIHKDLKSKNIFVDGKRVVITDFGLMGLHAVSGDKTGSCPGTLVIPDGWLCYLAPEVVKALRFPENEKDDVISTLPYTAQSDVYAFGTVWYELLSGSWPFSGFCAESIIWQVGSGKKQNLSQLQGRGEVKDILMQSWAFDPSRRPDFSDGGLMGILKKLQTQIPRSLSSHPRRGGVNRGISHERLFDPLRHGTFSTIHDLEE
ncbi:uncharacterized protein LOC143461846 isoform X2 [Clavelina lepadiformis]|uniref:uncharacterized protein LOC143461846 isoform X2 n=1 Tax=Clavelina lepadiformis TaxID=159417 RepID=UPI00404223B1